MNQPPDPNSRRPIRMPVVVERFLTEAVASPVLLAATLVLAALPALVFAFAELPLRSHAIISAVVMAVSLWVLRRMPHWRLAVAILSVCMSVRYIVWRGLATLALDRPEDAILSILLS
ncbi:MAG: hypothetical protein FJ090_23225, partial [Deltaproteobacteria bacterium]|nr:hypothetical protein [Deltaproteobacteria bacterium]